MTKQKMYRCQNCGRIVTKQELEEEIFSGSMGLCFCEYTSENRILNKFEEI